MEQRIRSLAMVAEMPQGAVIYCCVPRWINVLTQTNRRFDQWTISETDLNSYCITCVHTQSPVSREQEGNAEAFRKRAASAGTAADLR
jgi:hypothetical protein